MLKARKSVQGHGRINLEEGPEGWRRFRQALTVDPRRTVERWRVAPWERR